MKKIISLEELKNMVPEVPEGRLPSKKSLEGAEVLLKEVSEEATITVYKNGYLLYEIGDEYTVYTVRRCGKMTYRFQDGTKSTIDSREYDHLPWQTVVSLICNERLDVNRQERESEKSEFHLNGDGTDWCDKLSVRPEWEVQEEEEEYEAERQRQLTSLREAMKSLTPRQLQVVSLYYSVSGMTEKRVAEELGDITQQGVHNILAQALKKMKKKMGV